MFLLTAETFPGAKAPVTECPRSLVSVQVIAECHANSEGHFLMYMRHISLGPLTKATSRVMSDAEFLAPKPDGPTRDTESQGDVLLKRTVGF